MPEFLAAVVGRKTTLDDRYLTHAAYQSMDVYLEDWEQAHRRLGMAIALLRAERDARRDAAERGEWP